VGAGGIESWTPMVVMKNKLMMMSGLLEFEQGKTRVKDHLLNKFSKSPSLCLI
jgi:hypothetical protein